MTIIDIDLIRVPPRDWWREHAICHQTDPEKFFPDRGGSSREAKLICSRCPVQEECRTHALVADERFGVWGGMSENERKQWRRTGELPPLGVLLCVNGHELVGDNLDTVHGKTRCKQCNRDSSARYKQKRREREESA